MGRAFPVVSELIRGQGLVVGHPSMGLPPASGQKTQRLLKNKCLECVLPRPRAAPAPHWLPWPTKPVPWPGIQGPLPRGGDSSSRISYNSSGISLSSLPLGICCSFIECLEYHFSVGIPLLAPLWSHLYKAFPSALKLHTTL